MAGSILGHGVLRFEDGGMLTGATAYLDDRPDDDTLHVAFVRSPLPHAVVTGIDADAARSEPDVIDVVTAADIDAVPLKGFFSMPDTFRRPALATDVARFVGEPVAAVVAGSRAAAADGVEGVIVDYEPIDAVVDARGALAPDAPVLFPEAGSNLVAEFRTEPEGDLSGHDVVVRGEFVNQRVAGAPMEPTVAMARPDGDGVEVWCTTQAPFAVRASVAEALGLDPESVRVRTEAVGGGFGPKAPVYPEYIVLAALALRLGRAVRWAETRSENLVNMTHGRDQSQMVELGVTNDGEFKWLRADVVGNAGAYAYIGGQLPALTMMMATGPYRIPVVDYTASSAATNTTPTAAYRGAGRPEATAALERLIDIAAVELGIDPAELRRRNLLEADDFPLTTPSGAAMDSGDYTLVLDEVLRHAGYAELREEQRRLRAAGGRILLGIGMSTYVEVTAGSLLKEFSGIEVKTDGSVEIRVGTHSHGQGHATAYAQIVSDVLGVDAGRVVLRQPDTGDVPFGLGTIASRSMQIGGSAVHRSTELVLAKAKELAAHLLEASVDDIVTSAEGVSVTGVPTSLMPWAVLARSASGDDRPAGMEPGLGSESDFVQEGATYPFGAHLSVVEVDRDTGLARLVRHISVDDCGRLINPVIARGQVHGGIAQGAGQALFEEAVYDELGTPLTTTFVDYAIPAASELPSYESHQTETPTPLNPLGAKGIGESGTIGALPSVHNAVIDAVAHLGVTHIDMPLGPERVWRAIATATGPYAPSG